ncbi:MAG: hypothetical protein COA43_14350 [Robiginitomaculum sp.]|nr:MAG: hypothetical protein COA43_14350 [Robiginitomaculum sp.]
MQNLMNLIFRWGVVVVFAFVSMTSAGAAYADPFKNYSSYGGEVDREPNRKKRKSCSQYYYCGPTSTIELSMHGSGETGSITDDILGTAGYDIGENGTFEQLTQGGSFKNYSRVLEKIAKTRAADEGQKIKIVIPMIDYGYSGTFSNISIKASKSEDSYETLKRNQYGDHIGFTGSVTIEEYSPFVMKGSYSGQVYSYEFESGKDYRGPAWQRQPVKRVVTGTLNGKFNILSPWKGDDRINETIDYQSAVVDPMKNDIKRLAARYGIDIDVDKEFEKVDVNTNRNSRQKSNAKSVYGDCNCSCNFTQSATNQCKTVCRAAFDVCEGERYTPPVQRTDINKDELSQLFQEIAPELEELAKNLTLNDGEKFMNLDQKLINRFENDAVKIPGKLRDKFIVVLEQVMPGQAYAPFRENMIKEFDALPDDKSRMIMFIGLGGKE